MSRVSVVTNTECDYIKLDGYRLDGSDFHQRTKNSSCGSLCKNKGSDYEGCIAYSESVSDQQCLFYFTMATPVKESSYTTYIESCPGQSGRLSKYSYLVYII